MTDDGSPLGDVWILDINSGSWEQVWDLHVSWVYVIGIGGDPIYNEDIMVCLHCHFEYHPSVDVLWHVGTIG